MAQRNFVTVVSGVPRSGTSLVMQMLGAGGMPVMTDGKRAADTDNPRGYFEYEPVKRTASDSSWISEARGRAVKVIHTLLRHLPEDTELRILFVERDLGEVLQSQARMLARAGAQAESPAGSGAPDEDQVLQRVFAAQIREALEHAARRPRCALLRLSHRDLIQHPSLTAGRIDGFLGGGLDTVAMAECVDPALHRNPSNS
jgi:hypothetical protein